MLVVFSTIRRLLPRSLSLIHSFELYYRQLLKAGLISCTWPLIQLRYYVCAMCHYLFFISDYSGETKRLLSLYMCVRTAIC